MNHDTLFLIIEGAYILVAVLLGLALTRRGKPYRRILPIAHVFLAVLTATGIATDLIVGMPQYAAWARVALSLSALALLGLFVLGITILLRKTRSLRLADYHKMFAVALASTFLATRLFVFMKI
jgi:energy-converting hydrogenase Eha subunit A